MRLRFGEKCHERQGLRGVDGSDDYVFVLKLMMFASTYVPPQFAVPACCRRNPPPSPLPPPVSPLPHPPLLLLRPPPSPYPPLPAPSALPTPFPSLRLPPPFPFLPLSSVNYLFELAHLSVGGPAQ